MVMVILTGDSIGTVNSVDSTDDVVLRVAVVVVT
jgi:hypothetical protein